MYKKLGGTVALLAAGLLSQAQQVKLAPVFADAEKQTQVMLDSVARARENHPDLVSPRTIENGNLKLVPAKDWTSGFFAGELWMLYAYTHKPEWKAKAEDFTAREEKEKLNIK